MKRILLLVIILLFSLTLTVPASAAPGGDPGTATITLLNPPPGGTLVLAVGESYTFEVQVTSTEPFTRVQAAIDQFYPGRSIFAGGVVGESGGTSATLYLTITGKRSTAELPDGIAPIAVAVGVRYGGGALQSQYIPINLVVN